MAIVINPKIQNLGPLLSSLGKIEKALSRINGAVDGLNARLAQAVGLSQQLASNLQSARIPSGGGGSPGSSGPISGGQNSGNRTPQFNPNRTQQLKATKANPNITQQLPASKVPGAYRGRKPPIQRAPSNPFVQMALKTRYGFGKFQVLGSSIANVYKFAAAGGTGADIAGVIAKVAPLIAGLAGPIAIAVGAIMLFAAAAKVGADAAVAMGQAMVAGGGTANQAGAARAFGGVGIDVAGLGRGLSPIAAAGAGVSALSGPFVDMNYNRRGLKALEWIRTARNMDEARRGAEFAGQPGAASAYLMSGDSFNRLWSMHGTTAGVGAMADIGANLQAAAQHVENILQRDVAPFLDFLAKATGELADFLAALDRVSEWLHNVIPGQDMGPTPAGRGAQLGAGIGHAIGGPIGASAGAKIGGMIGNFFGGGNDPNKAANKTAENTKRMADDIHAIREGTFGGGPRAQGAVPSGLRPYIGGVNAGAVDVPYGVL